MGTLIDTKTVLTTAHQLITLNSIVTSSSGVSQAVIPNSFYQTLNSMYTISLGLQTLTNTSTAQIKSLGNLTIVS